MGHYGKETPKRHVAWSNAPSVRKLDLGPMRGWTKWIRKLDAEGQERPKTVRKYVDKQGRTRYQGVKGVLKKTECRTQFPRY